MLHTQVVRFFFKQIVTFYFAWISKLSTACGGSVAGRAGHAGDPVCVSLESAWPSRCSQASCAQETVSVLDHAFRGNQT